MLGPNDVVHLAAVWDEQLERKGVPESLFNELTNRVVDRRLRYISAGEQAPTISIELILAVFAEYKGEISREYSQATSRLERLEHDLECLRDAEGDEAKMDNRVQGANYYAQGTPATFPELVERTERQLKAAQAKLEIWTTKYREVNPNI